MPLRSHIAALLTLGGLAACAEPPSYALRWTIEGKDGVSAANCAESGLFQVRARIFSQPGIFVDERVYPCFSEALEGDEGRVSGSTLDPGHYAIELRGIDRASRPWDDAILIVDPDQAEHRGCAPEGPGPECRPNERVCDCMRLDVDADGLGTVVDGVAQGGEDGDPPTLVFSLDPPGECEDGIDNDRDGRVDEGDPSCLVAFGDGTEGLPVGVTELQLDLSLLGNSPLETCIPNIGGIQVNLDTDDGPVQLLEDYCRLDSPYFASVLLPPGPATFSVVGLLRPCDEEACLDDPFCMAEFPHCYPAECALVHEICGAFGLSRDLCRLALSEGQDPVMGPVMAPAQCFEPDDQETTVAKTFTAEILPTGGTVRASIDFVPADFFEPIETRMLFGFSYRVNQGTETGDTATDRIPVPARNSCAPGLDGGQLDISDLRLTMSNSHGGVLDPPVRLADGTPLDGTSTVPCFAGTVQTEVVEWVDGYTLTAEALSAEGEVCFRLDDIPMRPGETSIIELPRVYDAQGDVPASCRDCVSNGDCNGSSFGEAICLPPEAHPAGTCQYPCSNDSHCQLDATQDSQLTCAFEEGDDGEPLDLGYCAWAG